MMKNISMEITLLVLETFYMNSLEHSCNTICYTERFQQTKRELVNEMKIHGSDCNVEERDHGCVCHPFGKRHSYW